MLLIAFWAGLLWADCLVGNLNDDCQVNWEDLRLFAEQWLNPDCSAHPDDCADLDDANGVNWVDFALLAENWFVVRVGPLVINEFMASNGSTISDPNEAGEFPDWIELYNGGTTVIELAGMYLTDDLDEPTKWQIPAGVTIESCEHLLFWADDDDEQGDYHTNFKLEKEGEQIGLFDIDGVTAIDSITFGGQRYDISCGRFPDANDDWRYCLSPTPGEENNDGYLGLVADTEFSVDRGFYETAFDVDITCETEGATIRYTLNGSEPKGSSDEYTGPINISTTSCLRAAAFKPDWLGSNVDTQTYIFVDDVIMQSPDGQRPGPGWPFPYSGSNRQWTDYGMDPDVVNDPCYVDLIEGAMLSVPTISLVTDLDNLFDFSTGIYMNAEERGILWERPTSVELVNPDGSKGFQVDAGIRIRGGISRIDGNPKHSFRLFFRAEYGDAKLEFPMFGDEGVDEFDHIDLRCGQNYSWHFMINKATENRDVFSRDAQRDMGQPYTRSRYYHVYINGQYWGLYQSQERSEASFAESYFGGEKEDYDVVKVGSASIIEATDGNLTAYRELWNAADNGFGTDEAYYHVQGLNTDGVRDPNYKVLLDVDNLADYMIVIYYAGNRDGPVGPPAPQDRPRNFYAIYNHNDPDGFKYFAHDCEFTLESHLLAPQGVYEDRTTAGTDPDLALRKYFSPMRLHQRLVAHPEYVMRFADRVHKHFFNDGALTPPPSTARFVARANEIDLAIIAESARWGDAKRSTPYTKNNNWLPLINAIVDDYFNHDPNTRTDIVLGQFIAQGWYPTIEAPTFNQHGGEVSAPFDLTISAPEDDIYYTMDGNDPRLPGGAVSSSAIEYDDNPITLTETTHVKARVLDDDEWSALTEAVFVVASVADNLRITEIMYHPQDTGNPNDPDTEFIELKNIGPGTINLNLVSFTDGIDFTFPWLELGPNEYVVVVKDQSAFEAKYGTSVNIAGQYSGRLNNAGEDIELEDANSTTIHQFDYEDDWYPITDGFGFSLTIIDPCDPNLETWDRKFGWRPSALLGGSPGSDDGGPVQYPGAVVINEVLTHSHAAAPDWIELHNTTEDSISIGEWFLSDSDSNLAKYEIAAGTTIDPGDYIVFYEDANFDNLSDPGCLIPFALSENGEEVCLVSAQSGVLTGYQQVQEFGASEAGISFGRYKKSTAEVDFVAMDHNTPGLPNAYPKIGPIVITEIMYHPKGDVNTDAEYVELYNITDSTVNLFDAEANPWKFEDDDDPGIDYLFGADANIPAYSFALLIKNNVAFNAAGYPSVPPGVQIFEWGSGKLSNGDQEIILSMPGDLDGGERQYIRIDSVEYSDGSHPVGQDPWPTGPDGEGDSLTRIDPNLYGNDPNNWTGAAPSPGE